MIEARRDAESDRHFTRHGDVSRLAFGLPEPQGFDSAGCIVYGAGKTDLLEAGVSPFQPVMLTAVGKKHLAFFCHPFSAAEDAPRPASLALADAGFVKQPVQCGAADRDLIALGEQLFKVAGIEVVVHT